MHDSRYADAKRRAGEEKQSDPRAKMDLYQRIVAPEGTPDKIYTADALYAALKDGKINTTDHAWLNSHLASGKNEDGPESDACRRAALGCGLVELFRHGGSS